MKLTVARPRVFLDADVIFAGSAAPSQYGSSQLILLMGEITLLDCVTCEQAITEVERNLSAKLPHKLAAFRFLVDRCLHVIADPTLAEIEPFIGQANPKDLPILVAALQEHSDYLLTFDTRHFSPKSTPITVQRPGDFLMTVRDLLSGLALIRTS